jgi:hypothetical protein
MLILISPRETEVNEGDLTPLGIVYHNILGLQIPVDYPLLMQGL